MKYTVSTLIFKNKKEAIKQLKKWYRKDRLNYDTKLFQVKKVIKYKL